MANPANASPVPSGDILNGGPVQKLNALFKVVYADKMERLIPDDIMIQRDIKFSEADKLGEKFIQPVMLTEEQGFTFDNTANAFKIEDPVVAEYRQAVVNGTSLLLSSAISYEQAARASNGSAKSFEIGTYRMLSALRKSVMKRIEILLLYGNSSTGIARVSEAASLTSTKATVQIKEWADGIWSGAKNVVLDVLDKDDLTSVKGTVTVEAVNLKAKTLDLSTETDFAVVADDVIVFTKSQKVTFDGLDKIISTQVGEQFAIKREEFDLWRSNVTDAANEDLSVDLILATAADCVGRGLSGDVKLYVNHKTYEKLNAATDTDKRRVDSSYSKDKIYRGTKKLCFVYQRGLIEVTPSTFVKENDAFMLSPKICKRIGATDVTFNTPGNEKDQIFHRMEKNAGYAVRCYTHQALFIEYPAHCAKIANIKV